jgi:hypothetical protein
MPEKFRNIITGDTSHRKIIRDNASGMLRLPTMAAWGNYGPHGNLPQLIRSSGQAVSPITIDTSDSEDYHAYVIPLDTSFPYISLVGRLYLSLKVLGTNYKNDFAISTIGLFYDDSSSFDSTVEYWSGASGTSVGDDYPGFETLTDHTDSATVKEAKEDALGWAQVTNSSTSGRWNRDYGGTASNSTTGPLNGCRLRVDNAGFTSLSSGNTEDFASQDTNQRYLYTESSSTTVNDFIWLRTPVIELSENIDYTNLSIVIIYYARGAGLSNSSVRAFWDSL